jgi:glycerol-3-phosphate dehydrogenase
VLNIFGGKITTYRKLAEEALGMIGAQLPVAKGAWTAGVPLPGGDFPVDGAGRLAGDLRASYPFLTGRWAQRLVRAYGTEARELLGDVREERDLGRRFGADLTEREVGWLMEREYARTAEDVLWRRTKLGLSLSAGEAAALDAHTRERRTGHARSAAE